MFVEDRVLILGVLVETTRHVIELCLEFSCAVRELHSLCLLEVNAEVILNVECGVGCHVRGKLYGRDNVLS